MGKLVLHLADGSTRDLPLVRERTTIGRRPDNDVCLPVPTVSGEHAAVVTVMSDSFLEDLGSRNGTLVNGKEIRKHFLRDHDEIDIGGQRLVYLGDQGETVDTDGSAAARPVAEPPAVVRVRERSSSRLPKEDRGAGAAASTLSAGAGAPSRAPDQATIDTSQMFDPPDAAAAPVRNREALRRGAASLEVLDGRRAGTVAPLDGDEVVLGRLGVQVAAVQCAADGHRLVAIEGAAPPTLNGAPLPADGALLASGDEIVVAGTRVRFRAAE